MMGAYDDRPALPLYLGPMRWSRAARYSSTFAPRWRWVVDAQTIAQHLVTRGFDGGAIFDEAGGDDDGAANSGVIAADDEAPCN